MNPNKYRQEKLNSQKPFKQAPRINARIELSLEKEGNLASLKMKQIDHGERILKTIEGSEFLIIMQDAKISFILTGNTMWRWSDCCDGITTKEPLADYYGGIEYSEDPETHIFENENVVCGGKTESKSLFSGYSVMSFYAKFDKSGVPGRNHGYNLNIELKQPSGKWLPITIDPDMKNPPPTHT